MTEDMQKALDLCESWVEKGRRRGADAIEVYFRKVRALDARFEKNDLQVPKGDDYQGVGIRVVRNGRLGFSATNVLDEQSLQETLQAALEIAAASPADPNLRLPEPGPAAPAPVEGISDPSGASLTLEDAIRKGQAFLQAARDFDGRVTLDSLSFAAEVETRAIASSTGIRAAENRTLFQCVGMGFARDGEEVSSFDMAMAASCRLADVRPEELGRDLAQRVVRSLGARTVPSFVGTVVLHPLAAVELIAGILEQAASAESIQNEMSPWKGKLGQTVASNLLTVVDDPRIPGGAGSTAFDREGVVPAPLEILRGGVLQSFLHNTYTARKEGLRASNGRAVGTDQGTPGVGVHNLSIEPGDVPLEAMIRGIRRGLIVNRYSGSADPVSGDFSGVVKGGIYVDNGAAAYPVKEVMIAGNIYKLLRQVAALSTEVGVYGSYRIPYIQLEDVTVTGK